MRITAPAQHSAAMVAAQEHPGAACAANGNFGECLAKRGFARMSRILASWPTKFARQAAQGQPANRQCGKKWGKTGGSSFATGAKLSGRTHPEGPIARIFTSVLRHWQRRAGECAVSRDRRTKVEDASHSGRSSKVAPARRPKRYFSRNVR